MALLTLLAALAGWMRWLSGVPTASAASSSDISGACTFLYSIISSKNSLTMPGAFCRDLSSAEDGARALQAMAGWTDGSLCSWPLQQGWEPVAGHTAPWHTVQGIL